MLGFNRCLCGRDIALRLLERRLEIPIVDAGEGLPDFTVSLSLTRTSAMYPEIFGATELLSAFHIGVVSLHVETTHRPVIVAIIGTGCKQDDRGCTEK